MPLAFFVLTQYRRVTDRRPDRQTRCDRYYPRQHSVARVKSCYERKQSSPSVMNQLERCWNLDGFASVRVYVSMSDKVVDQVMRRRGSRGLGWLKQPPTVEHCETIPNRRFVMILWSGGDRWLRRAISDHWTLRIRHLYNIMNSELMVFGMRLIFTLWRYSVSWQAKILFSSFHY